MIKLEHVSKSYSAGIPALNDVSLNIEEGEFVFIVGDSGSGKSTLIKLLLKELEPTEGTITLNGIDIWKYNYEEYTRAFSVVFQDFAMFSLPVGENIAASSAVDEERAWEVLEEVELAERVRKMKDSLKTQLYNNNGAGVDVSGGEAQKIAIARALYKDAPFIILDEPTAALDPVAEAEIYAKFNEIAGDKTAIYISHRLSSCKFCDEIAVFDHGEVIQQGTHERLLADPAGKYYELWNAQAQYYTEEPA